MSDPKLKPLMQAETHLNSYGDFCTYKRDYFEMRMTSGVGDASP